MKTEQKIKPVVIKCWCATNYGDNEPDVNDIAFEMKKYDIDRHWGKIGQRISKCEIKILFED